MSEYKKNKNDLLGNYISKITDQELKVLLLKLKNEIKKPEVLWDDIKSILIKIGKKDEDLLKSIVPLLLND